MVTLDRYPEILEHCRAMRSDPTDAEDRLWRKLRNRQLDGMKFRRQHPIGPYIVDFCCHEANLAIELDGSGHEDSDQADYDRNRSADLQSMGIIVMRFWNHEVRHNLEGVLEAIREVLAHSPSPSGRGPG
jgi:very-short-patch-repair endonuclease